ncbi:LacI family transcriptional regulator [Brucella endophytica]|uniref:LacI family transcriptional regulator n=1 Tax=Brucella endophytica TaxID=1963359 RepID=A0A916SMB3_9HYPH|nr:transporter substrate-binding domain-containing protein [Brucella endophytica]GGB04531.1 LacI family transcriptional regulator [Brucella endophytica]
MTFSKMKQFVATAILGTMLMAGVGHAASVTEIVNKGTVKIGVLVGAPPYGSIDSTGNPVGYDADVATLVGKYLGVTTELVALTPPSRIPALESGKVDFLVATLAPTAERAKAVMFTIPYSAFQVAIYAPKGTAISGWDDLKGKRVGVNRGSSVEKTLVDRGLEVVRFDDDATTIQALFSGQVDAVAEPDAQANAALKMRPNADMQQKFVFSVQPNSMTVRRDEFELHQWLNNVIYIMKQNGELEAISQKWVGSALPSLPTF